MTFYGDLDKAVLMAGNEITEDDINEEIQDSINTWIDENIYPQGFGEKHSADEYYDIYNDRQTELILKNFPVIDITSITDDVHATSPTSVNSDCFVCDNETGIIQLITAQLSEVGDGTDYINYFTKGFNSVRVVYNYGYEEIPFLIARLATLMAAKWVKTRSEQGEANGLKSVTIGDYKETYDIGFMGVKSEYDDIINDLYKKAIGKYSKGY